MPNYSADSFDIKDYWRLRKLCFSKMCGNTTGCWCYNPDGTSLPCNQSFEPTPLELIGKATQEDSK